MFLFCEFLFRFLAVSFAFFFAVFSPFRFGTFSLQAFEGFAHLFLYLFFSRFYFGNNLVFLFFFRSVATFGYIHFIFANAFAFAFFAVGSSPNSTISSLSLFFFVFMTVAFAFFLLFLELAEVDFLTYHFRPSEFLVLSFNHTNRNLRSRFFLVFSVLLFLFLRRGSSLHQRVLINSFIFLSVGFRGFFLFDVFVVFMVVIFIFFGFSRFSRSSFVYFYIFYYYGFHRSRRSAHNFGFRSSFSREYFFLFFTPVEVNFAYRFESCQLCFGTNHFLFLLLAFFLIFLLLFHTDSFTLFAFIFYNFFRNRTLIFVSFKFV